MPMLLVLLLLTLASGCRVMDNRSLEIPDPEPGVTQTLAEERARAIQGLSYDLVFTIPSNPASPITAHEIIRFSAKDLAQPIILDFTPAADHLKSIKVGGKPSHFRVVQDHILIPREEIADGDNTIEIEFVAGDAALNRNPDFMYTLFVPSRARTAFPCFDQPNLKARLPSN